MSSFLLFHRIFSFICYLYGPYCVVQRAALFSRPRPLCQGLWLTLSTHTHTHTHTSMGGCSALNYMLFVRGNSADYDLWEEKFDCAGWSYKVPPDMKESEHIYNGAQTIIDISDLRIITGGPNYHNRMCCLALEGLKTVSSSVGTLQLPRCLTNTVEQVALSLSLTCKSPILSPSKNSIRSRAETLFFINILRANSFHPLCI